MIFKILGEQGSIWYYDNQTNTVYDSLNNPIDICCLKSVEPYLIDFNKREDIPLRYWKNNKRSYNEKYYANLIGVKNLKIQLGLACNYNCLYCSQRHLPQDVKKIDVDSFFAKLEQFPIDWTSLKTVEFWGGEPLVYWKIIPTIASKIREFGFTGWFHLTTNTSLFSEEVYNWAVNNNVDFCFSHDGVNHKEYRSKDDWLDDPDILDRVLRYHKQFPTHTRIECVNGPYTDDNIKETLQLFRDKLGDDFDILFHFGIRLDNYSRFLLAKYDVKRKKQVKDSMFDVFTESIDSGSYLNQLAGTIENRTKNIRCFMYRRLPASYQSKCPTLSKNVATIDIQGNWVLCHQSTAGWFSQRTIDNIESCYTTHIKSIHEMEDCAKCPYIQTCGSKCSMYNKKEELVDCKSTKWVVEATFEAVWFEIFGERPVKIIPQSPLRELLQYD